MTTRAPAVPKRLSTIMWATAARASSAFAATMVPLPEASPSALTTIG